MQSRTRVVATLCAAVLLGFAGFLVWAEAVPAYQRMQATPAVSASERLALPQRVFDPSPYAPATDEWGAPGPVGLVFRGRGAREGFGGDIARPWYAVSARTGQYWRLAAPHVQQAVGGLWLSPPGTQAAWAWPGGVSRYDLMTGETRTYRAAADAAGATGAAGTLAWSPDSTRIAYGGDPVRVLDTRTGDVTELALRVPPGSATSPSWTADGRWITVVGGDAVEAVAVDSGERRRLPVGVGGFRGARWSGTGDVAGLHPRRHGDVLRIVHSQSLTGRAGRAEVVDEVPEDLVIEGLWGWVDPQQVVLTGLRPDTGGLEHAMAFSLRDDTLRTYMQFPTLGDNWAGLSTVSLAHDLLREPTRGFAKPPLPWSHSAKLLTCMLVAVFPVLYFVLARQGRRPRRRRVR